MKVMLMHLAVWAANIVYLPFRLLKMKNKVSIISRQSDEPTLDIILLSEELKKQSIEHVVLAKRLNKSLFSATSYARHMLKQMYHIATSRVILLDGYCILISVLPKNKNQTVIQMWHSMAAIKKFGWQTIDKQWGSARAVAETMKLHRNYDYAIAPSRITADHFSEAFRIDRDKVKLMGLPRIDYLLAENPEVIKKICNTYPQLDEKTNVLYAPTFRKNTSIEITSIIESFDFETFNLVLKKHWLDKTDYSWAEKRGVIIDNEFSSLDWMKVCTKVITDYSAISIEAAIMDKEIYLYLADIDDYSEKVGTNVDFKMEAISEYVYEDAATLCKNLSNEYKNSAVQEFKEKFVEIETDDITKDIVTFVKNSMK